MNYRYDTSMFPRTDVLRVCMSCWRRLPSFFTRKIHRHAFPATTNLTCNGTCGTHWKRAFDKQQPAKQFSANQGDDLDISKNPFFAKYQEKLKHMQEEKPDEFSAKLEMLKEERQETHARHKVEDKAEMKKKTEQKAIDKPAMPGSTGPVSWPPKSLDELMKLDLVKDLDAQSITHLWQTYQIGKDNIFSVVPTIDYDVIIKNSQSNPNFLFTLPKGDGFEFYLCQFDRKDIYFTPLGLYQLVKENAPACLIVAHFPELKDSKGIVLMAAEYDDKVINKTEALNLVKQMAMFYGKDAEERSTLVQTFNKTPEKFQYLDLVEHYKKNREHLENNPY